VDTEIERSRLLDEIRARADPAYENVVERSVSSSLAVYGLRVWEIREIVKGWRRDHKHVSLDELLPLVETLWDGESREEGLVALELLQHYPHFIPDLSWAHFERWRQDLDAWELTDVLGLGVLGPWVAHDTEHRGHHLRELQTDADVWSRRLGLVGGIGWYRTQKAADLPHFVVELIDRAKDERHPAITKGVSWALRYLVKTHPEQVAAYLEENEAVLARHVLREVRNKLQTGRKDGKNPTRQRTK
jgi:3-methyladenine DNA glycosylase AlkD